MGESSAVAICDRLAQTFEAVLKSEAKTNRAAQLLGPLLRAWVVTVVGAVAIVALLATSVPWWALASAVGVTAAGGGAALVRRRRRPASIRIPGPRAPS